MCIKIKGKFEITPYVENLALITFNQTLTDKVNNKQTSDPHVWSTDISFFMMTRVDVTKAIAFTVKERKINKNFLKFPNFNLKLFQTGFAQDQFMKMQNEKM